MTCTSPDDALAVGIEVAHAWAEQDRLDPHRPTLPQLVAQTIERRAADLGRRSGDGADRAALLDLLDAVERLAVHGHEHLRDTAARARRHVDRTAGR